jgi:arginyl-tRNA synthetase
VTPGQLAAAIADAIAASGQVTLSGAAQVRLRAPQHPWRGDWTTAIALELVPGPGARVLAETLAARLGALPGIERVDVAGPGFLNITLGAAVAAVAARNIVEEHEQREGGQPPRAQHRPAGPPANARNSAQVDRVRFAHGRACAVIRQAGTHGVTRSAFEPHLLTDDTDQALLTALSTARAARPAQYPDAAQRAGQPHQTGTPDDAERLLGHLDLLAGAFASWYAATRLTPRGHDPVTDEHRTRLWLAQAARIVLADGLTALGLTAPERI